MRCKSDISIILFKDIGALSEENFDGIAWINKTLKSSSSVEQNSKQVQLYINDFDLIYCKLLIIIIECCADCGFITCR